MRFRWTREAVASRRGAGDSATLIEAHKGRKRARPRPAAALPPSKFGEWLSLVEHLVRDQGVGGSNPLSPTILSHLESIS
jgi:hypothetical protein